jgi:excinuclease ABC subunit A
VVALDQGPLTANRRSNAATYTKAWEGIRRVFARTEAAQARGLDASSFSFNTEGGRCPECKGEGTITVDMQFMADVTLRCELCDGRRFTPKVLEARYRGRSIADVLDQTVDQAIGFFAGHRPVVRALAPLQRVGLGYLRLGQPAPTLSGGEAQRVKLAAHLGRRMRRPMIYLFDEPTTGLHGTEVGRLVDCLDELVEQGHTVIVIEHNMDLVSRADWVIDLGPGGGEDGGRLVASGRPEEVAAIASSHTAAALRPALARLGLTIPPPVGVSE